MAAEAQIYPKQRRKLRSLAHGLKPVVTVGSAGLTTAVLAEIEIALEHHELLKIKLSCGDKAARIKVREAICATTGGHLIQEIGGVIVIYRKKQTIEKKRKPEKKRNTTAATRRPLARKQPAVRKARR